MLYRGKLDRCDSCIENEKDQAVPDIVSTVESSPADGAGSGQDGIHSVA